MLVNAVFCILFYAWPLDIYNIYIYRDEPYDILCECERYTRRQSHIQLAAIQCVDGFDIVVAKHTAYHTFIGMDIPKISIRSHFNAKGYEESWKVSPPRPFPFEQIMISHFIRVWNVHQLVSISTLTV